MKYGIMLVSFLFAGCSATVDQYASYYDSRKNNSNLIAPPNVDLSSGREIRRALYKVNKLINGRIEYVSDEIQYGEDEYWVSPIESIASEKGDCEDYEFLKYDILLDMGFTKEDFKMLHVNADQSMGIGRHQRNRRPVPHMVLAYYGESVVDPLILDNMKSDLVRLSSRTDLAINYAFTDKVVWKGRGSRLGKKVSNTDLLERLQGMRIRTMSR